MTDCRIIQPRPVPACTVCGSAYDLVDGWDGHVRCQSCEIVVLQRLRARIIRRQRVWLALIAVALLIAAILTIPLARAEEHLPAGTRIERPGLPVMVTGTGELGAWIFSRQDVERVVVDEDDLERCRVDLRACQATVGKQEQHVEDSHAIVPWLVAGGVLAAFTGGVWVGVHAR